jgi:hypothetical protein
MYSMREISKRRLQALSDWEGIELYSLIILVLQMYYHRKHLLLITRSSVLMLGSSQLLNVLIGLQPL